MFLKGSTKSVSFKHQVLVRSPEFQKTSIFGPNRIRQFAIFWWQPARERLFLPYIYFLKIQTPDQPLLRPHISSSGSSSTSSSSSGGGSASGSGSSRSRSRSRSRSSSSISSSSFSCSSNKEYVVSST